eukprot:TRINITY_DN371_c0_g1_i1.p1 TRINITY_DN371_c0_g1~~TRINITY_DN371_c0_g1_i1.p1  ORF type:complete len:1379 (-),score=356.28 TRINITY_DN371_c0_g1_i1:85-3867(-)
MIQDFFFKLSVGDDDESMLAENTVFILVTHNCDQVLLTSPVCDETCVDYIKSFPKLICQNRVLDVTSDWISTAWNPFVTSGLLTEEQKRETNKDDWKDANMDVEVPGVFDLVNWIGSGIDDRCRTSNDSDCYLNLLTDSTLCFESVSDFNYTGISFSNPSKSPEISLNFLDSTESWKEFATQNGSGKFLTKTDLEEVVWKDGSSNWPKDYAFDDNIGHQYGWAFVGMTVFLLLFVWTLFSVFHAKKRGFFFGLLTKMDGYFLSLCGFLYTFIELMIHSNSDWDSCSGLSKFMSNTLPVFRWIIILSMVFNLDSFYSILFNRQLHSRSRGSTRKRIAVVTLVCLISWILLFISMVIIDGDHKNSHSNGFLIGSEDYASEGILELCSWDNPTLLPLENYGGIILGIFLLGEAILTVYMACVTHMLTNILTKHSKKSERNIYFKFLSLTMLIAVFIRIFTILIFITQPECNEHGNGIFICPNFGDVKAWAVWGPFANCFFVACYVLPSVWNELMFLTIIQNAKQRKAFKSRRLLIPGFLFSNPNPGNQASVALELQNEQTPTVALLAGVAAHQNNNNTTTMSVMSKGSFILPGANPLGNNNNTNGSNMRMDPRLIRGGKRGSSSTTADPFALLEQWPTMEEFEKAITTMDRPRRQQVLQVLKGKLNYSRQRWYHFRSVLEHVGREIDYKLLVHEVLVIRTRRLAGKGEFNGVYRFSPKAASGPRIDTETASSSVQRSSLGTHISSNFPFPNIPNRSSQVSTASDFQYTRRSDFSSVRPLDSMAVNRSSVTSQMVSPMSNFGQKRFFAPNLSLTSVGQWGFTPELLDENEEPNNEEVYSTKGSNRPAQLDVLEMSFSFNGGIPAELLYPPSPSASSNKNYMMGLSEVLGDENTNNNTISNGTSRLQGSMSSEASLITISDNNVPNKKFGRTGKPMIIDNPVLIRKDDSKNSLRLKLNHERSFKDTNTLKKDHYSDEKFNGKYDSNSSLSTNFLSSGTNNSSSKTDCGSEDTIEIPSVFKKTKSSRFSRRQTPDLKGNSNSNVGKMKGIKTSESWKNTNKREVLHDNLMTRVDLDNSNNNNINSGTITATEEDITDGDASSSSVFNIFTETITGSGSKSQETNNNNNNNHNNSNKCDKDDKKTIDDSMVNANNSKKTNNSTNPGGFKMVPLYSANSIRSRRGQIQMIQPSSSSSSLVVNGEPSLMSSSENYDDEVQSTISSSLHRLPPRRTQSNRSMLPLTRNRSIRDVPPKHSVQLTPLTDSEH